MGVDCARASLLQQFNYSGRRTNPTVFVIAENVDVFIGRRLRHNGVCVGQVQRDAGTDLASGVALIGADRCALIRGVRATCKQSPVGPSLVSGRLLSSRNSSEPGEPRFLQTRGGGCRYVRNAPVGHPPPQPSRPSWALSSQRAASRQLGMSVCFFNALPLPAAELPFSYPVLAVSAFVPRIAAPRAGHVTPMPPLRMTFEADVFGNENSYALELEQTAAYIVSRNSGILAIDESMYWWEHQQSAPHSTFMTDLTLCSKCSLVNGWDGTKPCIGCCRHPKCALAIYQPEMLAREAVEMMKCQRREPVTRYDQEKFLNQ
ncbi:hypothetical protein FGB62_88g01 [Gracilaria domingensis]|nr:hypothetical protein FGB62_88g01 [Gracilaria domingensis]